MQIRKITWEEILAFERGVLLTQVWWNLGLSSVPHNQTSAANERQKQKNRQILKGKIVSGVTKICAS